MEEEKIDPGHKETRNVLRIAGPVVAVAGLVFIVIGLGSFFAAFGSFGPPRYFWCAFVGMPLLAIGGAITSFGYIGRVARYKAGEVAPVGKDVFNYLAEGSKEGVKAVASAVGEGLGIAGGAGKTKVRCRKCGHLDEEDAKFCSSCGQGLTKSKSCPTCRELNDPDAGFCDKCGYRFAGE
jgi:RNA polymerase subunit RPABC4/transcription elongation factor Spt4